MKSQPYPTATWMMPVTHEPQSKFQKSSALKMKTSTKTRKTSRTSPKQTPLPPLPSISTLFESGSSSHSSSTNSSYGSYCQFSPEGSYTMYHWPMNYIPYVAEQPAPSTSMEATQTPVPPMEPMVHSPPSSADEHKPVTQPLFIQTADYPYNYEPDLSGGYPSSATINASQLLLRPVPNGHV